MSNQVYVTFPTLRKRGLVTMFLSAWDGPTFLFAAAAFSAVGSIYSAITMKSASHLGGLASAALLAGLGYLLYRKTKSGTSYIKSFFKLRVLRKDAETGGYRYLNANEYSLRHALSIVYMPVAFSIGFFPIALGAALGGALSSLSNSNRFQGSRYDGSLAQKYEDDQNNQRNALASGAGAMVGAALVDKLATRFPWMFTLHDTMMNTIVINETPETKEFFAKNKELFFDAPSASNAA